jgi:hypothetical protein
MINQLSALALTFSVGIGCVGEGSAHYRGVVTSGSQTSYSFDAQENPAARPPVAGAAVSLFIKQDAACSTLLAKGKPNAITDERGHFDFEIVFPGTPSDTALKVCAAKAGFETFEYNTVYEHPADPVHAEKAMNIQLRAAP